MALLVSWKPARLRVAEDINLVLEPWKQRDCWYNEQSSFTPACPPCCASGSPAGREIRPGMGLWGCCREHWRHRCEMGSWLSSVPCCVLLMLLLVLPAPGTAPRIRRAGSTVCRGEVTLPKASLTLWAGPSWLCLAPPAARHTANLRGSSWNISASHLFPQCGPSSQRRHLACSPSLPPSLCKHLQ